MFLGAHHWKLSSGYWSDSFLCHHVAFHSWVVDRSSWVVISYNEDLNPWTLWRNMTNIAYYVLCFTSRCSQPVCLLVALSCLASLWIPFCDAMDSFMSILCYFYPGILHGCCLLCSVVATLPIGYFVTLHVFVVGHDSLPFSLYFLK